MSARLQSGIDFMKAAHRSIGQTRKDGKRPYEIHPMEVMARVAAVDQSENLLIAALLHDVLEDVFPVNPYYNSEFIFDIFGSEVSETVQYLTDQFTKENFPLLNRATRKQLERERYATMSEGAKTIKLADIITNMLDDGGEFEESFGGPDVGFNRMYLKEKELCLHFLEGGNPILFSDALLALNRQKKKFDVR